MTFEPFDLVDSKLEEADRLLTKMGEVVIHPRHKPGFPQTYVAIMSIPGTIVGYDWHKEFEATLNAFLAATHSVPDIITKQLGYDAHGMRLAWYRRLGDAIKRLWHGSTAADEEKKRRKEFQHKFDKKLRKFRKHPLSDERHEVIHRSGLPHWEVRVKGRFTTFTGGPMNPLPAVEELPIIPREDPKFWLFADSSPLPLEPKAADFWWVIPQANGPDKSLPLFDECRAFLHAAQDLEAHARQLHQAIHQGKTLTKPPR
jgi:hypothetical protein